MSSRNVTEVLLALLRTVWSILSKPCKSTIVQNCSGGSKLPDLIHRFLKYICGYDRSIIILVLIFSQSSFTLHPNNSLFRIVDTIGLQIPRICVTGGPITGISKSFLVSIFQIAKSIFNDNNRVFLSRGQFSKILRQAFIFQDRFLSFSITSS